MPWRLQAQNLFLTYPKCEMLKETALENVKQFFGAKLDRAVVSRELHEDGTPHLHMLIQMKQGKRYDSRNKNHLDSLVDPPQHGNYQSAKKLSRVLKYVIKDGDTASYGWPEGEMEALLKKAATQGKNDEIAEAIKSGARIPELLLQWPGYCLLHMRAIREFILTVETEERRAAMRELANTPVLVQAEPQLSPYDTATSTAISQWMTMNLRKKRAFKQSQLWIHGPPSIGKTSTILWMEKEFNLSIYWMPAMESFYDEYADDAYDLVVLDEFKGTKSIQELNLWLQGSPMSVRVKGGQRMKRQNLPIVILSNFSPAEAYSKCSPQQLAPLMARLDVVNCHGNIRVCRLQSTPEPTSDDEEEEGSSAPDDDTSPSTPAAEAVYDEGADLCLCGQRFEECGAVGCACRQCGDPMEIHLDSDCECGFYVSAFPDAWDDIIKNIS